MGNGHENDYESHTSLFKRMNILITGIHGFVGNNLVDALKNHHTIYGL